MAKRDADSSIEKQVALLKALYGHGQISHKMAYERSAMQNYERRRNKPCTHVSIHLHLCPRAVSGKIKMCAMRNDYFI
nr:protachykinin-1 isoform X3 [Rattus norvegicus]